MSAKHDITNLLTLENKTELVRNDGFYTIYKDVTTARFKSSVQLHSFLITTKTSYYRDYIDPNGKTVVKRDGITGPIIFTLFFEDGTHKNTGVLYACGSGKRDKPNIETQEKLFDISEANKRKKIQEVRLDYNSKYVQKTSSSTTEIFLEIVSIKAYSLIVDFDTGIRIKGANGHIYKILGIHEQSSLRVKTPTGIKNIKIVPPSETQNTQLRIKTKQGIMAIALEE
jgi:hypothetical protein